MSTQRARQPEDRAAVGRAPSGTREAILAAASHQFAEHGYDRAALRAIADDAGVDQKLIAYYFGSKQQLFVAAVGLPLNPAETAARRSSPATPAGSASGSPPCSSSILEQPELHQRLTGVIRAAASEPEHRAHDARVPHPRALRTPPQTCSAATTRVSGSTWSALRSSA